MTVRELLGRMDSMELAEWMAYDSLEPVGPGMDRGQEATLLAMIANMFRDDTHPQYRPRDFMPWLETVEPEPAQQQSWQDMLSLVSGINQALGGGEIGSNR